YIDGNSYGKWIIQNNTFAPANGWKNLRYTYNIGNMRAPYNWWGSATNTTIDGYINDYLDSNGGGWVNYTPFYTSTSMNQLDWNGTSPSSLPLPRSVSGTLIFNQTMSIGNSPYYLIGPLSIAPGVRLTIEPGVEVYANTTNSSITVYGELHAEGTVASPIEFGINPAITRNCNQGWWSGIQSSTPNMGNEPLLLRNVTMWGTRQVVTSGCSNYYTMLNTYYFGRSNSFSALDNLTFYDGGSINFQSYDQSASWEINNIEIHNVSYVYHNTQNFRMKCNGGNWNGKVSIADTNTVNLASVGYYSTGSYANYCHNYDSSASNWTFDRINSVSVNYGSNYWGVGVNNPIFFQGDFTEVNYVGIQGYYYGSQDTVLRESTFTESRVNIQPSQQSNGKMNLTNNTFVDSQIILTASSQASTTDLILEGSSFSSTKAPTTGGSWTDYYIDGNSYGKWIIQNNTFAPANGWKNLRYTYSIAPMVAKYNYWGSSNRTTIDTNINDINDNNGGN
ncbi:MAG TPA: hypothetical protein QF621_06360, partial [Candidatus Thalassarchaeaceae archaeon]|nr:hypothetical protein [Candidatus Thalassarchaeaceae archaeon]